ADRPWRCPRQRGLVLQSWPRRIAHIGTIRLADRAPFQEECDTDANQNDCPHDSHVEIPDAPFDQCRGDSGDCEQRAGDSTMEWSVTPEADEARDAERTEKQCVSEWLECGPNRSNKQAGAIDEHKRRCPETHRGGRCATASRHELTTHTSFLSDTRRRGGGTSDLPIQSITLPRPASACAESLPRAELRPDTRVSSARDTAALAPACQIDRDSGTRPSASGIPYVGRSSATCRYRSLHNRAPVPSLSARRRGSAACRACSHNHRA